MIDEDEEAFNEEPPAQHFLPLSIGKHADKTQNRSVESSIKKPITQDQLQNPITQQQFQTDSVDTTNSFEVAKPEGTRQIKQARVTSHEPVEKRKTRSDTAPKEPATNLRSNNAAKVASQYINKTSSVPDSIYYPTRMDLDINNQEILAVCDTFERHHEFTDLAFALGAQEIQSVKKFQ